MISIENALKKALIKPDLALVFLSEYLAKDKSFLLLNPDFCFDEKPFFALLKRYLKGEPFEYIFKKASFYGEDFYIEKGVLIPRFDTELLLELCVDLVKKRGFKNILEIGFGSGIISIMLAKLTKARIKAVDISEVALKVAYINAQKHGVSSLIDFELIDYKELKNDFDLIFSNPPYVSLEYELDPWVKKEPSTALFGGLLGHEFIKELISYAKKSQCLACEIGYDQKDILSSILAKQGFDFSFYKDLAHHDRAFVAFNRL